MKTKPTRPKVICISGRMGSGKSTVAGMLAGLYDVPVYNADNRAKELMHEEPLRRRITEAFGDEAYQNGQLNTRYLAAIVFTDAEQLKKLEEMVHPQVREDFRRWVEAHAGREAVVLENAVLFKSGMDADCDYIIWVQAPEAETVRRVQRRDGLTEEQIYARLKHQPEEICEQNRKKSRFICLDNRGTFEDLLEKVRKIYDSFKF